MTKTSTDAQIVGSVSFINGDAQQFTDAKAYLDCIREELPPTMISSMSTSSISAIILRTSGSPSEAP